MPQLDLATYSSQIFWLITCLSVLFVSLKYYFIPRLESSIKNRQRKIEKMLSDAQDMRLESENLNKIYEEEIKKAHLKNALIAKEAVLEFDKKCTEKLEALSKEHSKKYEAMSKDLEKAKKQFLDAIESKSQNLLDVFVAKALQKSGEK